MTDSIKIFFSEKLSGTIWKTLDDPENTRLFLEVRDQTKQKVSFFCLDLDKKQWLWKDISISEESWWISLAAISKNVLLLNLYDSRNPDQISVIAFDVKDQKVLWWKNNFSLAYVVQEYVVGTDLKFGAKQTMIRLSDGTAYPEKEFVPEVQNLGAVRPFQYHEGTSHFETVRTFLKMNSRITPVKSLEYCEYGPWIVISALSDDNDLANYLMVFTAKGDMLLMEKLGEHLKGIGLDTFFIFSSYLIFVKNKCELVSYKLV